MLPQQYYRIGQYKVFNCHFPIIFNHIIMGAGYRHAVKGQTLKFTRLSCAVGYLTGAQLHHSEPINVLNITDNYYIPSAWILNQQKLHNL